MVDHRERKPPPDSAERCCCPHFDGCSSALRHSCNHGRTSLVNEVDNFQTKHLYKSFSRSKGGITDFVLEGRSGGQFFAEHLKRLRQLLTWNWMLRQQLIHQVDYGN